MKEKVTVLIIGILIVIVYFMGVKIITTDIDYDDLTYEELKNIASRATYRMEEIKEDFDCEKNTLSKSSINE